MIQVAARSYIYDLGISKAMVDDVLWLIVDLEWPNTNPSPSQVKAGLWPDFILDRARASHAWLTTNTPKMATKTSFVIHTKLSCSKKVHPRLHKSP